jgi:hypothetical protein
MHESQRTKTTKGLRSAGTQRKWRGLELYLHRAVELWGVWGSGQGETPRTYNSPGQERCAAAWPFFNIVDMISRELNSGWL